MESARVHIKLEMGFSSVSLDGQLSGDSIEGTFTRDDTKAKFKIEKIRERKDVRGGSCRTTKCRAATRAR